MSDAVTRASATKSRGSADKREAILDAALELFVELGFHGTAVPQIAKRAGVGAGTIYRYFESKEALVNALYREWKTQLATHLLAQFVPTGDAREQFLVMWRRMADFVEKYPTGYAFIELHHHADYLDDEANAVAERYLQLAIAYIASKQMQGEFRPGKPELMWSLVEGAFMGLARFAREGRLELTQETIDAAGEAAWEIVRPPPAP